MRITLVFTCAFCISPHRKTGINYVLFNFANTNYAIIMHFSSGLLVYRIVKLLYIGAMLHVYNLNRLLANTFKLQKRTYYVLARN